MIEKISSFHSLPALYAANTKNPLSYGTGSLQIKSVNLNNQPNAHYGRISFGIDDAGKKPVAKRIDGSADYQANRELIQGKRTNLESNLEERMADESKCTVGGSIPIEFYPEDLEKLKHMDSIDDRLEYLAYMRREQRYIYLDDTNEKMNKQETVKKNNHSPKA